MVEIQRRVTPVPAQARGRNRKPRAELALDLAASEERYRALFETMPMGVVHYDADGSVIEANQAASDILGVDLSADTTWPLAPAGEAVREDGSPWPPGELPVPVALRTGRVVAEAVVGIRHLKSGDIRWVRVTAVPDARGADGRPSRAYAIVTDLSEQRRAEAARARAEREQAALLARAQVIRAEAESTRERLAFLMQAGALVAATRDRGELLDQVTRLVVPSLADYCAVYLPAEDGMLRASAINHRSRSRTEQLGALRELPVSPAGPLLLQRAFTSGSTQLSRDVMADMRSWKDPEPNVTTIVKLMRPGSRIATPLLGPQGSLGVIVLGRGTRRARFTAADVQVVEELGRRLTAGLANTDAFAREHAIAETLQRSLLPAALPQIPGLDLAVRYLPATEGADVGGDWYDAFPVPGGLIGLVTGDVAGHSIASASVMGQVRNLLRGYAIDEAEPARVLERTNNALTILLPDVIASVVYAVLDPASGELRYANAGHPPPLMAARPGRAEYLDDTEGTMLGACADNGVTTGHRVLPPGARLVLYTDGLIEDRRRDITDGLAILAATLRGTGPLSAEQTCARVQEALLGTAQRADDVCLLTARLVGLATMATTRSRGRGTAR